MPPTALARVWDEDPGWRTMPYEIINGDQDHVRRERPGDETIGAVFCLDQGVGAGKGEAE